MQIHKIEVARRQLETAIDLFFSNGDISSIVTLAGAAEEIFGKFLERGGKANAINHIVSLDKREFGGREYKIVINEINGTRNALKHAKCPTEDIIEITNKAAFSMLARAILNYSILNDGQITSSMHRVFEYLELQYPLLEDNPSRPIS